MIPEERSAAVARGLREVFGVTTFEDIQKMTKGLTSSLVFRIVVQGKPYLLRVIMRQDSTLGDQFTCTRAAADAGLGPRVWYTSIEDRICITDFVESVPFSMTEALVLMPATLRTLHSLPPFPRRPDHLNTSCMFLLNKGPSLDGLMNGFRASKLFPPDESEEFFTRHSQLISVLPRGDSELASSHNDLLRPENILFDGQRVWLVDWEAAFLNDRYADLAVVANFVAADEAEQAIYLQKYFGQAPDEYQLARLFLMQQLTHMFYAIAFLMFPSQGKAVNLNGGVPDFRDFHRRMWAGELDLGDINVKLQYGKAHWARFIANSRRARFDEALRIVSDRHARS